MKTKSTRDAYGDALERIGIDERVVVLDADLSVSTKTVLFAKRYPERFIDVGCAEQNLIGVAAGLALGGKTVFASTYAIFVARAWEQIRNTIAHDDLTVKIAASHAGLTNGPDGASHQALEDIAIMRVIPRMRVIVPVDAPETEEMIAHESRQPGPAYIRLNREETPSISDGTSQFTPGKAVILRDGSDVALFATGSMVHRALLAAEMLAQDHIDAAVVNIHTIKPIDTEAICRFARRCGAAVSAEEHSRFGGLGSAIAEVLVGEYPIPLTIIGVNDRFGESGVYQDLMNLHGLTGENIAHSAKKLVEVRR